MSKPTQQAVPRILDQADDNKAPIGRLASLCLVGVLSALAAGSPAVGQDPPRKPASTRPTEPWADPGLKVTRGLALWLDAGRLNAARKAHGQAEAPDNSRVDTWFDASGHGRHFTQPREEARPRYLEGALHFDGEASYLERAGMEAGLGDFTVFLVAAPLSNAGGFHAFLAMHHEGRDDFTSGVNVDMGFGYTGRFDQGTLRTDGDRLIVGDADGRWTIVDRADVEATSPSSSSIMPEGLDTALGPDRLRDLPTFLLTDLLGSAKIEGGGAPPPRRRSELDAVLKGSTPVESPKRPRIVLAAGPKDHGPGEHDYPLWRERWSALFATDPNVAVETADGWPSARQLETADVIAFYSNNPGWDAAKARELDRYLARGGGAVLIHYAVDGHQAVDALAGRIGLAWQGGKSAFRHGPLDVDFSGSKHPIARGFEKLRLVDESYWDLVGDPASVEVIGTGVEASRPRPLFWTRQAGRGRVFVSIPGHFTWTFDDPLFRLLILRGMAWAAGEPVDRFNELTTLGARIGE